MLPAAITVMLDVKMKIILINNLPKFQITVHYLIVFLKFALSDIDSGNIHP